MFQHVNAQVNILLKDTSDLTHATVVADSLKEEGLIGDALRIYSQLQEVSNKCKCDSFKIHALKSKASIYRAVSDFKQEIFCLSELELLVDSTDLEERRWIYDRLGNSFGLIGDINQSQRYYYERLNICAKTDTICIASSLNGIARGYANNNYFKKAISTNRKARRLFKLIKDTTGEIVSLNQLGISYQNKGDADSAKYFYKKGLDLAKFIQSDLYEAQILNNLGDVYGDMKEYKISKAYFVQALKKAELMQHPYGISICKFNLGDIAFNTEKYNLAIKHLEQSLVLAQEHGYVGLQKDIHEVFSKLYEKTNVHKMALSHYQDYITARDSFKNKKVKDENVRREMLYEVNKKRAEYVEEQSKVMESLRQKSRKESKQRDIMIMVLIIVIALGLVITWFYKEQMEKNKVLEEQSELIQNQQKKIIDSLNYAQKLQKASLISLSKFKSIFQESFIFYEPKHLVSGDLYWATETDKFKAVAVIDCTGHGVPGAFMSMIAKTLLNNIVVDNQDFSPASVLSKMHAGLFEIFVKNNDDAAFLDGMDMSLCVINKAKKQLCFSGAVHDIYRIHKGELESIKGTNSSIGGISFRHKSAVNKVFNEVSFELEKGDLFYLFTDGYIDQFGGEDKKKLNISRFKAIIEKGKDAPIEKQGELISNAFYNWRGEESQIDDVLVLGFKV